MRYPLTYTKNLYLSILLFISYINTYSQKNLIANGSFEDVNICKEYSAPCSPSAWLTTSSYLPIYSNVDNNKFVEICVFNSTVKNIRSYIQIKLLCPLIKNHYYKFSIDLKPDNIFVESIGILFTNSYIFNNNDFVINRVPSINLHQSYPLLKLRKRNSWRTVNYLYHASGNENIMIIGNFEDDNFEKRSLLTKVTNYKDFFFCIDNVSLIPVDTDELCNNYAETLTTLYNYHYRHTFFCNPFDTNSFKKKEILDSSTYKKTSNLSYNELDTLTINGINFDFDSIKINNNEISTIDSLFKLIDISLIESIIIHGHTDSIGNNEYNLKLSYERAKEVSNIMKTLGLNSYIIEITGFGATQPISDNNSELGRKRNRRVEIIIKYKHKLP